MKRELFIVFVLAFTLFCLSSNSNAQTVKLSSVPFKEQLKSSLRSNYKLVTREIPVIYNAPELRSDAGVYFDWYQLSLDNMPCLIPKFPAESNFGVFYPFPGDFKMPNFFAQAPDL